MEQKTVKQQNQVQKSSPNFRNISHFLSHVHSKAKKVTIPSSVIKMKRILETPPPNNINLAHSKFPSQLSAYDNISGKYEKYA